MLGDSILASVTIGIERSGRCFLSFPTTHRSLAIMTFAHSLVTRPALLSVPPLSRAVYGAAKPIHADPCVKVAGQDFVDLAGAMACQKSFLFNGTRAERFVYSACFWTLHVRGLLTWTPPCQFKSQPLTYVRRLGRLTLCTMQ